MNSIVLNNSGAAYIKINIASLKGVSMQKFEFLIDTGATITTIPKGYLIKALGYTDKYILDNKIILSEKEKPTMANGKKIDVYKIPITRMNIGGYEIQHNGCILTSDTVKLGFLLGSDILRYFKFTFDFDATENNAPYGRMFYELRNSQKVNFKKVGSPFAYQIKP